MNIQKNVELAQYTTFKTGGKADFFCEVKTKEDLLDVFAWIKKDELKYFILGNGSNLLVSDSGFRGVAVKLVNDGVVWGGNKSVAGAGVLLPVLINEGKKHNLGGMEWAYGIPATLGGAVRNNAGAFGSDMGQLVESVETFDIEKLKFDQLDKKNCAFSYHNSAFHDKPAWVIWEATLRWKEKSREDVEQEIQRILAVRKDRQPMDRPSAGSYFRNPTLEFLEKSKRENLISRLDEALRVSVGQTNTIPAAYLIEAAELKGKSIGGAQVSEKHANFIINTGNAKTEDVIILASMVKQKVRTKLGVQLQEEVEYVGF